MFLSQVLHLLWNACTMRHIAVYIGLPPPHVLPTQAEYLFSSCPLKKLHMLTLSTSLVTLYTLLVQSGMQHSVEPLLVSFLHLGMKASSEMCEISFLHDLQTYRMLREGS